MKISPRFAVDDWYNIKFETESDWIEAIEIFKDRIEGRFLKYVRQIQEDEFAGFMILGIDCLLIETLMQFMEGMPETPDKLQRDYFVNFLTKPPFSFVEPDAKKFYWDFRNGILHQAEIKGSSKVRRGDRPLVERAEDGNGIIINRDKFHAAIQTAFHEYITALTNPVNAEMREKFRRKMNFICGSVIYFAYGSNMETTTMAAVAPSTTLFGKAKLMNHELRFNKISTDGSGKANIVRISGKEVWGVAYIVDPSGLSNLDEKEKGYRKEIKPIYLDGEALIHCMTYVSNQINDNLKPKRSYKDNVLRGAKEHSLPGWYSGQLSQTPIDG